MKHYLFLILAFFLAVIFVHVPRIEASQCNSIQSCCMTVNVAFQATNWPGGSLHVYCHGDRGHFCRDQSVNMQPGDTERIIGCSCLRDGGCMQYGDLPAGCHFVPNPIICTSNGQTTSGTIHVVCDVSPTPTFTPTQTPTNTPTPITPTLTPRPQCGIPCSDDNICQQFGPSCNKCLSNGPVTKTCQAPQCGNTCGSSTECTLSSCNACAPNNPGDVVKICRPPTSQCNGYCDNVSVSCASNSGCVCDIAQKKCLPVPTAISTATPVPVSTIAPTDTPLPTATPTPAQCHEGNECTLNGGECANGSCSQINPTTGKGSCNCAGGGCVPGNACPAFKSGQPVPTPNADGDVCYESVIGGMIGKCCMISKNPPVWQINRCFPNTSPAPTAVATATPIATPTITPTPSLIQPTQEISMIPTPTANPTLYPPGPGGGAQPNLAQRWVCLQALPCSDPQSGCSRVSDHRVKLSIKTDKGDDAKPLSAKDTYIFECLQTPTGHKCTTGDPNLDNQILGTSNYPQFAAAPPAGYGYSFGGLFFSNGDDIAPNPIPVGLNNNGDIGTYEWESYTQTNMNRLFLAMNVYDPHGVGGEIGAQQQGILPFFQGGSKKCIQIKWDPMGQVYDKETSQPVIGAEVTLFGKNKEGTYNIMSSNDVLGGLENPVSTGVTGKYSFMVPDGTYKIQVKKDGYELLSKEVTQKGKIEQHNLPLERKDRSLIQKVETFVKNLLK